VDEVSDDLMSELQKNKQEIVLRYVIEMSLKNSETFLNDARLLINNSSYTHAFALIILAIEEMGKAIYCNWAKNGYIIIDKKFFKNIKSHRIKLKVLMEIERLAVLQDEINKKQKDKSNIDSNDNKLDTLSKVEKMPQYKSIKEFYLNLDNLKQDSLYVDIKDKFTPTSPDFFTKEVSKFFLDFAHVRLTTVKNALLKTSKD